MQRRERSPQERLDDMERKARLRVTVLCIICAVALFIEFLLSVTLPVKVGFNVFLAFQQSTSIAVNPGFQLGLTVFTTILGILVCLGELFANFGHYQRLLLAVSTIRATRKTLKLPSSDIRRVDFFFFFFFFFF
jgi:hypothetical protein